MAAARPQRLRVPQLLVLLAVLVGALSQLPTTAGLAAAAGGQRASPGQQPQLSRQALQPLPHTLGPPPFVGTARIRASRKPRWPGALPLDFDWQAYAEYNPDLAITREAQAAQHFLAAGRAQGRLHARVPLVLRYGSCPSAGLVNQLYAHIAGLTLALVLGADVVLAPAQARATFTGVNDSSQLAWSSVDLGSMLDVGFISASLAERGVTVMEAPGAQHVLRQTHVEYQRWGMAKVPRPYSAPVRTGEWKRLRRWGADLLVGLDTHPRAMHPDLSHPCNNLVKALARHVLQRAAAAARSPHGLARPMVLEVPCTLLTIRTHNLPEAAVAARHLRFTPMLQQLADTVIARMLADVAASAGQLAGATPTDFNGLHLRVEPDAVGWAAKFGGWEAFWCAYVATMASAGFTATMPLYVASGIFDSPSELQAASYRLAPYSRKLYHKEQFLDAALLAMLHPEQRAAVDFLVLLRSRRFVGCSYSTFSVAVREFRHLLGLGSRNSTALVAVSWARRDPYGPRMRLLAGPDDAPSPYDNWPPGRSPCERPILSQAQACEVDKAKRDPAYDARINCTRLLRPQPRGA